MICTKNQIEFFVKYVSITNGKNRGILVKKIIILGFTALMLAACGDKEVSKESNNQPKQEENNDEMEIQEAKAEVTEKVFYTWEDESIGNIPQLVTYAVIKNTGETNIDVSQTKLTYLDSDGNVIGTTNANEMYLNLSPSVIEPGNVAYLGISEDIGEEFEDLKDVTVEVTPLVAEVDINKLEGTKTKVVKTDDWGGSVRVTGFLNNKGENEASGIQASAGLYNKNKEFVGALLLSSDDTTTIQPGKESSIEFGIPSFPSDKINDVTYAEIEAMNFNIVE